MKQNPLHSVRSFRTGKDVASLLNRQENSSAILNVSPPSNETESTLYVIWKNLLSHDNFGVKNDFFKIGGNSLKAVQLVSRIVKEFLVNIQLTEIFLQPTIEKLAIHILRQEKSLLSPSIISIQPKPNQIPLSFSQERLWFIDQLEGSIQYHIPMVLHIKGELNKEALGKAWQQIVDRHEVLRTVFKEEGGQPYQILKEAAGWQLSMVDGTKYKQEPEALLQYIQQLINEPFDLSKNYMIRASLITVSDYEHVLALTMHHITTDAWSIPLIIKEVIEFYTALTENCPARLVPLTIQYADYALWERNYLQDEVLNSEIDYWKNKLENVSPLQLPTDYKRPPIKGIQGAAIDFSIGKTLSDQLQMLSHQQDTTLFMTLLAAFKILLHRYSGQQDICVGTSIANRRNPEVEELIGFFVNTLALRSEVNSDELFTDFLQQVKATTIEAYEHQDLSFEKVVKNVAKERDVSRSALFQVMLVMQNIPEIKEFRLGEVQLTIEELAHNTSKFDLTFFIKETISGLQVHVEYSTDLYNELTISRMLGHFKTLLGSIVKNPLQKISELSILTSEEEQQLLYQFNESKVEYPRDRTIIDLFEEQAAKTPETTAAVFEEEQLNYKQLNKKANQLAHYLRDKGV
ncbi:MAG: condensation domain-containing protein, partial [Segetibacter sp.]